MVTKVLPPPFPPAEYERRMTEWFSIVRFRESGVVMFPVRMDRARRITQFLRDQNLQKKIIPDIKKVKFLPISADFISTIDSPIELFSLFEENKDFSVTDLDKLLLQKYKDKLFVILITDAENLYIQNKSRTLSVLNDFAYKYRNNVTIIQFSELNILHPEYFYFIQKYSAIFNNIVYAPLYEKKEIFHFMDYLVSYFEMENNQLTEKLKEEIYENCGGHPWLVKEAIRYLRNTNSDGIASSVQERTRNDINENNDLIFHHEEMEMEIRVIWNGMMEAERELLKKITLGNLSFTSDEKASLAYLIKMKILNKAPKGFVFTQKLLEEFVEKEISINIITLGTRDQVMINGVDVSGVFSKNENKVLSLMIGKSGNIVSREELGGVLWRDGEYSDWALDRLISRVRKKLSKVGCGPKVLKTILGKGYLIN